MNKWIILTSALFGAFICSSSYAVNLQFLNESAPAYHFTDEDFSLLRSSIQKALNENQDGEKLIWHNPKSDNRGLVKPLNTIQEKGTICRKTQLINKAKDKIAKTHYRFCKQPSGEWKVDQ